MIIDRLFEVQDIGYREFHSRLVPDIPKENIIGVRVPVLRKLARELVGSREAKEFLADLPHEYYDENCLHAFITAEIKDYGECMDEVEKFLPYIDNWAVCDCFSPKVFKKHRGEVYLKIQEWISSSLTYTVRFGIVRLMDYLKDDFKPEMLEYVSELRSEEYYINMASAWYFSMALAKQYDAAIPYILENKLDKRVHNKSIQKAIESRQIDADIKDYLRTLKRG